MFSSGGGALCLDGPEAVSSESSVSPDLTTMPSETLPDVETTIVIMRVICCVVFRIIVTISGYLGMVVVAEKTFSSYCSA